MKTASPYKGASEEISVDEGLFYKSKNGAHDARTHQKRGQVPEEIGIQNQRHRVLGAAHYILIPLPVFYPTYLLFALILLGLILILVTGLVGGVVTHQYATIILHFNYLMEALYRENTYYLLNQL